jgi:hypothetical protein
MSSVDSSSSRVSSPSNAWIFGFLPDLLLGAGLLYLVFISGMILGGDAAGSAISPVVGSVLILVFSGAHYGATLLRVYDTRPSDGPIDG